MNENVKNILSFNEKLCEYNNNLLSSMAKTPDRLVLKTSDNLLLSTIRQQKLVIIDENNL